MNKLLKLLKGLWFAFKVISIVIVLIIFTSITLSFYFSENILGFIVCIIIGGVVYPYVMAYVYEQERKEKEKEDRDLREYLEKKYPQIQDEPNLHTSSAFDVFKSSSERSENIFDNDYELGSTYGDNYDD